MPGWHWYTILPFTSFSLSCRPPLSFLCVRRAEWLPAQRQGLRQRYSLGQRKGERNPLKTESRGEWRCIIRRDISEEGLWWYLGLGGLCWMQGVVALHQVKGILLLDAIDHQISIPKWLSLDYSQRFISYFTKLSCDGHRIGGCCWFKHVHQPRLFPRLLVTDSRDSSAPNLTQWWLQQ